MKLFFVLMLLSVSAFAQYRPYPYPYPYPGGYPYPYPYPFPDRPEDFCSKAQIEATTALVQKACDAKVAEFSSENVLNCQTTKTDLYGCRATCYQGETLTAKLRLDVTSNCQRETAYLRKTVIKWY